MRDDQMIVHTKNWLVDNLPYEVMWMTEKGNIEYANKAFCKGLGYGQKELISLTIYDINPRLQPEEWRDHWQEVSTQGSSNFKTYHQKKSGELYEVEVFAQFFSNNGKKLICAIFFEITESSFYRNVLTAAEKMVHAGGWKLNLQDRSLIVTEETFKIFSVTDKEEIRPQNIIKFFDDPTKLQELVAGGLRKAEVYDEVMSIKDAKGKKKWLRCTGQPVIVKDKVQKLIGVYQDITEQQSNAESLKLFKEVINHSNDIVFIWREDGSMLHCSDSAAHQLLYDIDELPKLTIFDLDSYIDKEWWKNHFNDVKERKNFRMEWIAIRKDGTKFPAEISVNYLFYNGLHLNCAIIRDISERKKRDLELTEALEQVKSLKNQLEQENEYLQEEIQRGLNFDNIICKSKNYAAVLKQVEQVAPTETTALITGESGTGKELLASAIHQNSHRKERPLIKVNCATLPKDLIESELFGHKKGAFTGAVKNKVGKFKLADGGTLFLDEIGELPLDLQPKLLRVLQEGEFDPLGSTNTEKVDVRIVAATNRDLQSMIRDGKFREDLFYRLNVFPIHNIPLRERREDIPLLAQFFLQKYSAKAGKSFKKIPKATIDALMKYSFPGNIRELENLIERAVIIEEETALKPGDWLPEVKTTVVKDDFKSFEEIQRDYIIKVLEHTHWRVSGPSGAATILDMKDKTLFAKIKRLGIEKEVKFKSRSQYTTKV
ncbi:MAG: sigma 54-interacting transcriptional regulator [Bacteroidota bacterium]